jgi:hypothetical protein
MLMSPRTSSTPIAEPGSTWPAAGGPGLRPPPPCMGMRPTGRSSSDSSATVRGAKPEIESGTDARIKRGSPEGAGDAGAGGRPRLWANAAPKLPGAEGKDAPALDGPPVDAGVASAW